MFNSIQLFGLVLLGGLVAGEISRRYFTLPRTTGYVLFGVLIGQSGLNWVTPLHVESAQLFIDLALGLTRLADQPPHLYAELMSTLEQDRQLVTMGIFRPSVLETDAELEKISPNSPRALQPLRQKLAATQLQQNRLQAEEALHPPATATSQPEDQQQRMCSLNNRAAVYLVPC